MRVVTHNVWVGQRPRRLRRNLARLARDTSRPLVIAGQEISRLKRTIPGYTRLAVDQPRHRDDLDVQLLVRDDVPVEKVYTQPVDGPWWIGPKHGKKHPPKIFVGVCLEDDGRLWDVIGVHRTWTGKHDRNMASWRAEHDTLKALLEHRASLDAGTRPVVALGDWNGRAGDRGPTSMTTLAREVGGSLLMRGIDGALTINVKPGGRVRDLEDKYGSDGHTPVVFDLEPAKPSPLHACPTCGLRHRPPNGQGTT